MLSGLIKDTKVLLKASEAPEIRRTIEAVGRAEDTYNRTLSDRLHTYWVNGLLSRPSTHIRNFSANAATLLYKPLETVAAATIDPLLNQGERSVYFSEAVYETLGIMHGLKDTFLLGRNVLTGSKRMRLEGKSLGLPTQLFKTSKWENYSPWTESGKDIWSSTATNTMAKLMTGPGQLLQGVDNLFKILQYRAAMYKYLSREAIQKGLSGPDIYEYISRNLTADNQLAKRAIFDAEHATFTDPWMNPDMQGVDRILGNKYFRWLTPFRKAPAKVFAYSIERSPLGIFRQDVQQAIKAGGAERAEAVARMTLGTAMASVLYATIGDHVYGSAPKDSLQRALWEASGKRENSIEIGGKFYKFDMFGPLGLLLKINADYRYAIANFDLDVDDNAFSVIGNFAALLTQPWLSTAEDMTFLRNFGELLNAVDNAYRYNDPGYLAKFGANWASSFVWSGLTATAQIIDPNKHNPDNPIEMAFSKLPFLTREVPVRYNLFGEPIQYDSNFGAEYIPYVLSQDKTDPLAKTLINDLQYDVPRLKKMIGRVKLTNEEYEAYQIISGQGVEGMPTLREAFEETLRQMQGMPLSQIKTALDKLVIQYREVARNAIRQDPRFNIAEREQALMMEAQ